MPKHFLNLTLLILALTFSASGCQPARSATPAAVATPATTYPDVPYELVSEESIFSYLTDLTSIQPYSGWRNSGSSGEAEALDYVANKLDGFPNLQSGEMELERESFKVFSSVELWETRLLLTVNGQEIEVPVNGLRGSRYYPQLALSMDSDGKSNDAEYNPVQADGIPLLVHDVKTFNMLTNADIKDRILFLDYAIIDTVVNKAYQANGERLMELINMGLDGVVLVTRYSNKDGESRGTFVGDGGVFQYFEHIARIPILHARLEDLDAAGIKTWDDMKNIETAHLTWDADVFIPGQRGQSDCANPWSRFIPSSDPDCPCGFPKQPRCFR